MQNGPYSMLMPYQPGHTKKTNKQKERERLLGKKIVIQFSPYIRSNILKPVFVNEPISNHNHKNWCKTGQYTYNRHLFKKSTYA